MRKALLVVLILSSALAWAQGGCTGQKPLNGMTTGGFLKGVTNASVRVCSDALTPCTTIPLFSDAALQLSISNPVTTDATGNYQYCAAPGTYNEQISSAGNVFSQVNNTPVTVSAPFSSATTIGVLPLRGFTMLNAGDSITKCDNGSAGSASNCWTALISNELGWTPNVIAVDGDSLFDQCKAITQQTINSSTVSTFLIGQNEGINAPKFGDGWRNAYAACYGWLLMPTKLTGQSASVTKTGTWTNSDLDTTLGVKTSTNGDSVTFSVFGSAVYVVTQATTACNSTYTVTIDGQAVGTITNPNLFTTSHSTSFAPQLQRFGNLALGTHTVVVTNTSGSCPLYFSWGATPAGQSSLTGPYAFAMTPYVTQTPVATHFEAETIRSVVSQFQNDGLGAFLTDLEAYCGSSTSNLCNQADTTHPNASGERVIANALENDATVLQGFGARQSPTRLKKILDGGSPQQSEIDLIESCAGIRGGVACDTFDRADNASSLGISTNGAGWTVMAGTLGISSHQAQGEAAGNNWATIDASSGDATVSVQIAKIPTSTDQVWMPFRVQDVNNYWRIGFVNDTLITLQKIAGGTVSGSPTTYGYMVANDILKVVTSGSTIAVYVNGKLRGSLSDATYSTQTKYGIQFSGTSARISAFALSVPNKTAGTCVQLPCVMASDTKTAQAANISATQLLASSAGGRYRLTAYLKVTQAATTSSALPNIAFLQCTDPLDSQQTNAQASMPANAGNGLSTANGGSVLCDSKAGTTISYGTLGYTTVGATGMQFKSYVVLERVQ